MKVIIAVLAGSFLSVVTNLVSNFLAPEADRHKTLVLSAFIGLVILIVVLTLWPDTSNREVKEIVTQLIKAREQDRLDFGQREQGYQADFRQREQEYQGKVRALTEAVTALTRQKGLDTVNALAQLRENNTEEAEMIFAAILERKVAEGQVAYRQAAEAARHLGALAFLHDTQKALSAYRRAVELDPANMMGWNRLGHLLGRIGRLDEAVDAYNPVRALGEERGDQDALAIAYGNLGNMYLARGKLALAEVP